MCQYRLSSIVYRQISVYLAWARYIRGRYQTMKLKSLIESGDPEQIATGFQFTEGPVWRPEGYLILSDIPASRMYTWAPDGTVAVWREPSGNFNGLTLDREGRLIACEHGNR